MQLSDITKIKGYYDDLIKAGDGLLLEKHIGAQAFTIKAIISFVVYGTSFSEFAGYGFYGKKRKEKRNYMTRRHMFRFFDKYNPVEFRNRIGDKSLAAQYYSDFMKREQYVKNEGYEKFIEFSSRYRELFIKKAVGWGGEGARIEKIECADDARHVWETLTDEVVVEPVIKNHDALKEVYPESLNTIKLTVLQTKSQPVVVTAIIRFGNNTIVDNVHSGGMAAGINVGSGLIETPATDKHFTEYKNHPITNKAILGMTIPKWNEIKELAIDASRVTPQLRYTSWDIALTNEGPVMIEGNWDAEFYMEQRLYNRGHRKLFTGILEGRV